MRALMLVLGRVSEILQGATFVRNPTILRKFFGSGKVDEREILCTKQSSYTLRRDSSDGSPKYLLLMDAPGIQNKESPLPLQVF